MFHRIQPFNKIRDQSKNLTAIDGSGNHGKDQDIDTETNIRFPRTLRLILLATLGLLLSVFAIIGVLFALINSEVGTRFLTNQAQARLDGLVEWQDMEGSLLGPLRLHGVTVTQPGLDLRIETLALSWQPGMIAAGTLQISSLDAHGIRLDLVSGDSPSADEPFNPAALQLPLNISLQNITISDLQLTQGGQPAQVIDQVTLEATLKNNVLDLQQLTVRVPQGGLSLTAHTSLASDMPLSLQATWDWSLPGPDTTAAAQTPLSGEFALEGTINWSEEIAFGLQYRASATDVSALNPDLPPTVTATGQLQGQYLGNDLTLEQLTLALADTPIALELEGQLSQLGSPMPSIAATMQWTKLQWPLTGSELMVTSPEGQLQLQGTAQAYELTMAAALAGADIPESQWKINGTGDQAHIQLEQVDGRLLGGELSLRGPVEWSPATRWDLEIQGRDLNPALQVPDLPGKLAFSLTTSGQLTPEQGLRTEIRLERLAGTLLDYQLDLEAQAQLVGETLRLEALQLNSAGNHLNANGSISPDVLALEWQLNAPAPGALIPGAAGILTAAGKITGTPDAPRMQAQFAGSELRLDTLTIPTLKAELQAGPGAEDKLWLDLATGPIQDDEQTIVESLQVKATGVNSRHTLNLAANTGTEQLQVQLKGGLDPALTSWRGTLTQFSALSPDYGNWSLSRPSALALAASELTLGNSCLQQEAGSARLCLQADWTATADSTLTASLDALPIELLQPALTGEASGKLAASLAPDGTLNAKGSLDLSPGQLELELDEGAKTPAHGGGRATLTIGIDGLIAGVHFAAPEEGELFANIQLPALTALPLAQQQPLAGYIRATLPDLSGLAAWVPELASSNGRLDADLQLAGNLAQPQILGELVLRDGAANIPLAGLKLKDVEFKAVSKPSQMGRLDITGGMKSGRGRADLAGQLNLVDNTLALEITGDRLQVYNTEDARILLTPDIQVNWADDILKLRGDLTIPRADITPRLGLSPATLAQSDETGEVPGQIIAPSLDVVVIRATQDEPEDSMQPTVPFRIDSEIRLSLGDEVNINALGFISQITGSVMFTNTPDQTGLVPIANGRFSVDEGTFRSFGQNLEIETGQLIFANVPATDPELNVRAIRWIDNDPEVTAAGVLVTGPATTPVLELFSRPPLDAVEVQSYLLTGRSSGDRNDVLSIGTYVSPRIYVGYGYNLLDETSEFNSLFSITPRYGVGASVGEADNNINVTFTHER